MDAYLGRGLAASAPWLLAAELIRLTPLSKLSAPDPRPGPSHLSPTLPRWGARGTIFLSNMRLVFVADKPDGSSGLQAFELPLAYISEEDFKQPIFFANNLSGRCGGARLWALLVLVCGAPSVYRAACAHCFAALLGQSPCQSCSLSIRRQERSVGCLSCCGRLPPHQALPTHC